MKVLKELNICETKNYEIKICELDLEKLKNYGKIVNEQIFIAFTYLFIDFTLDFFFYKQLRILSRTRVA